MEIICPMDVKYSSVIKKLLEQKDFFVVISDNPLILEEYFSEKDWLQRDIMPCVTLKYMEIPGYDFSLVDSVIIDNPEKALDYCNLFSRVILLSSWGDSNKYRKILRSHWSISQLTVIPGNFFLSVNYYSTDLERLFVYPRNAKNKSDVVNDNDTWIVEDSFTGRNFLESKLSQLIDNLLASWPSNQVVYCTQVSKQGINLISSVLEMMKSQNLHDYQVISVKEEFSMHQEKKGIIFLCHHDYNYYPNVKGLHLVDSYKLEHIISVLRNNSDNSELEVSVYSSPHEQELFQKLKKKIDKINLNYKYK